MGGSHPVHRASELPIRSSMLASSRIQSLRGARPARRSISCRATANEGPGHQLAIVLASISLVAGPAGALASGLESVQLPDFPQAPTENVDLQRRAIAELDEQFTTSDTLKVIAWTLENEMTHIG